MHTHTTHTLHNILSKHPPLKWSGGIWKGTSTTPSWWVYPTTAVTATATTMSLRWLTSSTIISTFSTTSLSITRAVSMNQKWHQLSEKTRDHSNWPRNKSARRTSMAIQIFKQELRVSTLTDTQRQLPIWKSFAQNRRLWLNAFPYSTCRLLLIQMKFLSSSPLKTPWIFWDNGLCQIRSVSIP